MEYGISTGFGSRVQAPAEWAQLISTARECPGPARLWALRAIAAFNYSAAQFVASALDPNLATPTIPTGSQDAARAMVVRWLASAELNLEEKAAVTKMWWLVDRAGASSVESNPGVPQGVRLLLRQGRA